MAINIGLPEEGEILTSVRMTAYESIFLVGFRGEEGAGLSGKSC